MGFVQTAEPRRERIEEVLHGLGLVLPARRLPDDGLAAWAEARGRGYEGLVGKDDASPSVGGRSLKWLKVKQRDYDPCEAFAYHGYNGIEREVVARIAG